MHTYAMLIYVGHIWLYIYIYIYIYLAMLVVFGRCKAQCQVGSIRYESCPTAQCLTAMTAIRELCAVLTVDWDFSNPRKIAGSS